MAFFTRLVVPDAKDGAGRPWPRQWTVVIRAPRLGRRHGGGAGSE